MDELIAIKLFMTMITDKFWKKDGQFTRKIYDQGQEPRVETFFFRTIQENSRTSRTSPNN